MISKLLYVNSLVFAFYKAIIHAFVGEKTFPTYSYVLKEGKIRTFENFAMSKDKNKLVIIENNNFILYCYATAIVREIKSDGNLILFNVFEFVSIENL